MKKQMKKQPLNEEFRRMQKLAGLLKENLEQTSGKLNEEDENDDEDDPSTFDVNQDWNKLNLLGVKTDHQGTWVVYADPEDPYLEEEGYSFAIMKKYIEQVANGERIGVEDGSSVSHYMTAQDAQNILNQIKNMS